MARKIDRAGELAAPPPTKIGANGTVVFDPLNITEWRNGQTAPVYLWGDRDSRDQPGAIAHGDKSWYIEDDFAYVGIDPSDQFAFIGADKLPSDDLEEDNDEAPEFGAASDDSSSKQPITGEGSGSVYLRHPSTWFESIETDETFRSRIESGRFTEFVPKRIEAKAADGVEVHADFLPVLINRQTEHVVPTQHLFESDVTVESLSAQFDPGNLIAGPATIEDTIPAPTELPAQEIVELETQVSTRGHSGGCGCSCCRYQSNSQNEEPNYNVNVGGGQVSASQQNSGGSGNINLSQIVSASGNQLIDGLLSGVKWAATTLTVQFPGSAANYGFNYGAGEANTFQAISQAQADAFSWAIDLVRLYTPLSFVAGNANTANIRMANYTENNGQSRGYYPDGFPTMGDIWMGTSNNGSAGPINNPQVGDFNFATHIHELGHALGLSHGHENGINGGTASQPDGTVIPNTGTLPSAFDNWNYSIMTYRSYTGAAPSPVQGNLGSDNPTTFMPLDILALQYMYGANYTTSNTGNTTYRWDTNGFWSVNGVVQQPGTQNAKMLMAIWDGGGTDLYDFTLHNGNQIVDLNPGKFSTFNTAQLADLDRNTAGVQAAMGNVANAFLFNNDTRSLIENVNTGNGNDNITGNTAANTINSNGGNDVIRGGGGNDIINGGTGADTMIGGTGNDQFFVDNAGDRTIEAANQGTDFVFASIASVTLANNIERLTFTDSGNHVGRGNALDNRLNGNTGNDKFVLDAGGADIFSGGSGSDSFDARSSTNGVSINLITGVHGGDAAGDTFASIEKFFGSTTQADFMRTGAARADFSGFGGNDTLIGGNTIDRIAGGDGNDTIFGGSSNDSLQGGAGNDTLNGGGGRDQFLYVDPNFGRDRIEDFQDGVDKIRVFSAVADDINDFTIFSNGGTTVVVRLNTGNDIAVVGSGGSNVTIDPSDFQFY